MADTTAKRALRERQPFMIDRRGEAVPISACGKAGQYIQAIYQPLVTPNDDAIGLLVLEASDGHVHVGAHILDTLRLLTVHLATLIESMQLQERLQHTMDGLLILNEAGQALNSNLDMKAVGSTLFEAVSRVCGIEAGLIRLRTDQGRLHVWQSFGPSDILDAARRARVAYRARRAALQLVTPRSCHVPLANQDTVTVPGWVLPLVVHDRVIGVLEAYGSTLVRPDTGQLLSSLANQAASALENARLYQELAARERQLHDLVGQLLLTQEQERRRVAHEVHDGLAQVVAAAQQRLEAFVSHYHGRSPQRRNELDQAMELARRSVREARRMISGLRPLALDDFGLQTALGHEVRALQTEGWTITYDENLGVERLPAMIETSLFRVAQEALTNIRKHAQTTQVHIALEHTGLSVRLSIHDNGRGFRPSTARHDATPGSRVGLLGMQERVALLGGDCSIRSRPGIGTHIVAEVPLQAHLT